MESVEVEKEYIWIEEEGRVLTTREDLFGGGCNSSTSSLVDNNKKLSSKKKGFYKTKWMKYFYWKLVFNEVILDGYLNSLLMWLQTTCINYKWSVYTRDGGQELKVYTKFKKHMSSTYIIKQLERIGIYSYYYNLIPIRKLSTKRYRNCTDLNYK
jgi:hypothetical protein